MHLRPSLKFWIPLLGLTLLIGCSSNSKRLEIKNSEARKRISVAIQIYPQHDLGYLHLARYYQKNALTDEAILVLHEGLKQIPGSTLLRRTLGKLYGAIGEYKTALSYYEQWIKETPDAAWLYLDRASLFLKMEEIKAAHKDLLESIRLNPKSYESHFLLGMVLARNGKLEAALESLIEATRYNDKQAELWFQISKIWMYLEDLNKAESSILRALELEPEKLSYLKFYVSLLEQRYDDNDINVFKKAQSSLETLLELFPEDSWVLAHYGNFLWIQGKYNRAESHLLDALKKKDPFPWAQFRLSSIYMATKRWELAIEALKQGLQTSPDHPWAMRQLALAYEMLGNPQRAIQLLQELLAQSPNEALYRSLSKLYQEQLQYSQAEEILKKGHLHFPKHLELAVDLAQLYESRQKYSEAIAVYEQLLPQLSPLMQAPLLGQLGNIENKLGHFQKSEQHFKNALLYKPSFHWARIRLIQLYLTHQQNEEAEPQLILLLNERPDLEWAYGRLALIYSLKKEFAAATKVVKRGLKHHPESGVLYEILGEIQEKTEHWNDALVSFQNASKQRPQDSGLLSHQGLVYGKLGDKEAAQKVILHSLLISDNSLWGWLQYILLQPQSKQRQWFGEEWARVRIPLQNIANRQLEKAYSQIQSLPQGIEQEMLYNVYHLLKGNGDEIQLPNHSLNKTASPWILSLAARIHKSRKEYEISKKYYQFILDSHPDDIWTQARLGAVLSEQNQWSLSNSHLQPFILEFPENTWVNFRLAINYTMQGDDAATIFAYQALLKHHPKHFSALNNLAWTYLTSKDLSLRNTPKALGLAQRAVEGEASVDHLDTLAEAFFQSGKSKESLTTIKKAIRKVEADSERYLYLKKQFERFKNGDTTVPPPGL